VASRRPPCCVQGHGHGAVRNDFSAQLDFIGGAFGAGASQDATVISAEFMKKDLARASYRPRADAMLHPLVSQEASEERSPPSVVGRPSSLAKDREAGVNRGSTFFRPFGSYAISIRQAIPYAPPGPASTQAPSRSITRDRCREVLRHELHAAADSVMAVVGDFAAAEMEKQLAAVFAASPVKAAPAP